MNISAPQRKRASKQKVEESEDGDEEQDHVEQDEDEDDDDGEEVTVGMGCLFGMPLHFVKHCIALLHYCNAMLHCIVPTTPLTHKALTPPVSKRSPAKVFIWIFLRVPCNSLMW